MCTETRFALEGDLKPGASFPPGDDLHNRQYLLGDSGPDLLANEAEDRAGGSPLIVNFYKAIADFFVDEVMASLNTEPLDNETLVELRRSVQQRAVFGYGVIGRLEDNRITAINPRFYWPLLQTGMRVGSVFVIPFNTDSTIRTSAGAGGLPNRALVAEVLDNDETATIYSAPFSGITLGDRWVEIRTGRTRVAAYGSGVSDYVAAKPIIDEIDKLIRSGNSVVERYGKPHIQVPSSLVKYNEDGQPQLDYNPQGTAFPVQRDDKDVQYITLPVSDALVRFLVELQISLLASVVSVPVTRFNIFPLRRMESGASIEALAEPANEKSLAIVNELIEACAHCGLVLERKAATPEQSGVEAANEGA